MLSPSSRLGDDLYALYVAFLAWFMLPFYGEVLAEVFPSDWNEVERAFDFAVPAILAMGAWSGLRGGPLMVTRAAVLYELGSPMSRRRLLLPWMVRQAIAWAIAAGIASTIILAVANPDDFTYTTAAAISVAAALTAASALFLAATWMVATRGDGQRRLVGLGAASLLLAPIAALAAGISFTSAAGLFGLAVFCATTLAVSFWALGFAPVDSLWRRATAVEAMRSSLQQFDFQRVLLDLRHAADQPVEAISTGPAARRLPLPIWRYIATVHHAARWHVGRLLAFAGTIAALFWFGDPREGIVTLAIAGCTLLLGLELVGPLAATADHLTFIVHYPQRSDTILRRQLTTSLGIAIIFGILVAAGRITSEPRIVAGTALLFAIGALGAAVQARLGSPDVAALSDKYGFMHVPKILWGRAMLGPGLVVLAAVAVFHQFMRPDIVPIAVSGVPLVALLVAGLLLSTSPLERAIR